MTKIYVDTNASIISYIHDLSRFEVCSLNWTKQCFASFLLELFFSIMNVLYWVWFTYCLAPISDKKLGVKNYTIGHPYITSAKGLSVWGQKNGNYCWRSVVFMLMCRVCRCIQEKSKNVLTYYRDGPYCVHYAMLSRVSVVVFTQIVMICGLLSCPDNKVVPA